MITTPIETMVRMILVMVMMIIVMMMMAIVMVMLMMVILMVITNKIQEVRLDIGSSCREEESSPKEKVETL